MAGRTIVIGDVHGCRAELEDLLGYVGLNSEDRVILVGDVVVRGPEPRETLALLRKLGAQSVRGNHEDRLLRLRAREASLERKPKKKRSSITPTPKFGLQTRKAADELRAKDWEFIASLPLWLDLPEHDLRVVHAGVIPGLSIEEQDPRALMNIRSLTRVGTGWPVEACEARGRKSWAHGYVAGPHIVFGHNAKPEPEIARCATGIDTGAVYGGRLTAMVLRPDEKVPPLADRESVLVSVPSRRAYVERTISPR